MDEIEVGIRYRRETGPIQLEGRLRLPDVDAPAPGVLLCHPHPMGGGDMDVPLMVLISEALCLLGAAVLRFNFAGVGSSRGVFTDGAYEPYDVQAAYRYLQSRAEVDGESINLVGWSFGSWMALVALVEGLGLPAGSLGRDRATACRMRLERSHRRAGEIACGEELHSRRQGPVLPGGRPRGIYLGYIRTGRGEHNRASRRRPLPLRARTGGRPTGGRTALDPDIPYETGREDPLICLSM